MADIIGEVQFKDWKCKIYKANYKNTSNVSLTLIDTEDQSPIAIATVNIDIRVGEPFVVIKDYAENKGMLKALVDAKIISEPVDDYKLSQYVSAQVCELLI